MVTDALYDNSWKLKNSETSCISSKEDPTESFQNFGDIKALNPIYKYIDTQKYTMTFESVINILFYSKSLT